MAELSENFVLISYSNNDLPFAEKTLQALKANNINCWAAFENLRPGENWPGVIAEAINQCKIFLLILTQNSNVSRQVIRELSQADGLGKKLYCFQIEDINISSDIQYFFASIHRHEAFKTSFEASLVKMVNEVSKMLPKPKTDQEIITASNENRKIIDRKPPDKSEPELEFITPQGISQIISEYVNTNEKVKGQLLIYKTSTQHTWIVATNRQLFCLLDDEKTRADNSVIKWQMTLKEAAERIAAGQHKKHSGLLDIGSRRNWLYSTALFASPESLMDEVKKLILSSYI